jgi:nucleoside-diphosphate-sugar epimerase
MRVFVTGASGHIASALIPELLANDHEVLGLARSEEAAAKVAALGAEVRRGELGDTAGLASAAAECDGVVHLAFRHDLSFNGDFAGAGAIDLAAVNAIGDALAGSEKPFVTTGGTLLLAAAAPGRTGTEEDVADDGLPRVASENATIALAGRVRSAAVRLAPMVHSDLDKHGFIPTLIGFARRNGFAAYVGDGANRWPGANTRDVARLYRLALDQRPRARGCTASRARASRSARSPRR